MNTGRRWSWLRTRSRRRRRKEEEGRRKKEGRREATNIKSNNPHLAGGEKHRGKHKIYKQTRTNIVTNHESCPHIAFLFQLAPQSFVVHKCAPLGPNITMRDPHALITMFFSFPCLVMQAAGTSKSLVTAFCTITLN